MLLIGNFEGFRLAPATQLAEGATVVFSDRKSSEQGRTLGSISGK